MAAGCRRPVPQDTRNPLKYFPLTADLIRCAHMISIRSSLSELERSDQLRSVLLECYLQAIRNAAQYAVELDDEITGPYRKYLTALADGVASCDAGALTGSRATLRSLMRD